MMEEISKLGQTLDRYHKELDSMKTRFSSDQKQRFIFDNIIDIFEQMC